LTGVEENFQKGALIQGAPAETVDEITYVRFASVYRSFKDVGELENLLKQMISKGSKVKTGIIDEAK
jgi:transcriptional repressor NrdR